MVYKIWIWVWWKWDLQNRMQVWFIKILNIMELKIKTFLKGKILSAPKNTTLSFHSRLHSHILSCSLIFHPHSLSHSFFEPFFESHPISHSPISSHAPSYHQKTNLNPLYCYSHIFASYSHSILIFKTLSLQHCL